MATTNISGEYDALALIGKGSFGTVWKVRQKSNRQVLVRKEIEYNSMNNQEKNQLISELRILRELNHENIVKYYTHDHIIERKCIHIYMEYCDGGDLAQLIANFKKNKETVPEEFVWQVMVQVLLALHRCHYGIDAQKVDLFSGVNESEPVINSETVVIHRDIKPDNIFLLNSNKTIKLGDFGLAKMLTSQNDFAKTYVGTPYYMSPEVLMDNPYSPVCDIWSLGCVLFELCTLVPPFQAKTHLQLQSKIKKGVIPEIPDVYSYQLKSIIRECITVDPEMRPSCFDLLKTLSVKFLRKEMELAERSINLNELQKQLLTKNEELKKKEVYLNNLEEKIYSEKEDLNHEYERLQMNCKLQKKKLEEELFDEFEARKKAMDLEAKEVRLTYQREFRRVVEQEVQLRLKDILSKQSQNELLRKKSDPSQPARLMPIQQQNTPNNKIPNSQNYNPAEHPNSPTKLKGPRELIEEQHFRRSPLKNRNDDIDSFHGVQHKQPFAIHHTRLQGNNYKKRVTDELERLSLEKRHTPEYEEVYMRKNTRH